MNPFLISPNNSMPSLEVKTLEMAIGGIPIPMTG